MESNNDFSRKNTILFWLLKTVVYAVVISVVVDNVVILVNKAEILHSYIPLWRRILVDLTLPVLYVIWSAIGLNRKLAEHAAKQKIQIAEKQKHESELSKGRSKEPVDYLEEQANLFRYAVIKEESTLGVDWDYLDGENKEKFTKELASLSELDEEKYQRSILYIWDRLISIYNECQGYIEGLGEQRSKEYCLMLQLEQEIFSYIAAAYYHSVFKDPVFCYRTILNKLGKEMKGNGGLDLIRRSADYCGISESLMLRYRNDQCVKCSMRGCMGRVDETHGILELVGPYCDEIIFKSSGESPVEDESTPIKGDALEQFKAKYGEDQAGTYLEALIAMMGYYPDMTFRKLKEPWDWCKETYSKPYDFKLPYEQEAPLIDLIFEKIKAVKDDETELEALLFSLISPFEKTCQHLMPRTDDNMRTNGAIALRVYSIDDSRSLEEFKKKLELALEETKNISKDQHLSHIEYMWVLNYALREKKGILPFGIGNQDIVKVDDIAEELHFYATIIEAALLRYGIKRDIFSYMRASNIFLTDFVDESEIGAVMDMNDDQVSTLVSRYRHSLSATSEDVFSVALEYYEPTREIDTSSVTTSEFKQHIRDLVDSIGSEVVLAEVKPENEPALAEEQNLKDGVNDSSDSSIAALNSAIVITDELKEYLEAFRKEGYLNHNYHWIRVKGHTTYHAGWMAKIIISNVEDVTYGRIEDIIKQKGLTDAASKCVTQCKVTKQAEVEAVCAKYGLSKKTC